MTTALMEMIYSKHSRRIYLCVSCECGRVTWVSDGAICPGCGEPVF